MQRPLVEFHLKILVLRIADRKVCEGQSALCVSEMKECVNWFFLCSCSRQHLGSYFVLWNECISVTSKKMSDESETCGGGGACSLNETTSKKNTPSSSSINETSEYRKSLLQAVPEEASMTPPNFQIPESNASDIAPSECSSYYRKGKFMINFPYVWKALL